MRRAWQTLQFIGAVVACFVALSILSTLVVIPHVAVWLIWRKG